MTFEQSLYNVYSEGGATCMHMPIYVIPRCDIPQIMDKTSVHVQYPAVMFYIHVGYTVYVHNTPL